jgi:hypothetical protein
MSRSQVRLGRLMRLDAGCCNAHTADGMELGHCCCCPIFTSPAAPKLARGKATPSLWHEYFMSGNIDNLVCPSYLVIPSESWVRHVFTYLLPVFYQIMSAMVQLHMKLWAHELKSSLLSLVWLRTFASDDY